MCQPLFHISLTSLCTIFIQMFPCGAQTFEPHCTCFVFDSTLPFILLLSWSCFVPWLCTRSEWGHSSVKQHLTSTVSFRPETVLWNTEKQNKNNTTVCQRLWLRHRATPLPGGFNWSDMTLGFLPSSYWEAKLTHQTEEQKKPREQSWTGCFSALAPLCVSKWNSRVHAWHVC